MTNSDTLLDSIVTSLRAIPDLVTLLGGANNITAYKPMWPARISWRLALWELKPLPAVLVLYRGTRTGRWGNIPSRGSDFSLIVRDGEGVSSADIIAAIENGIPTGCGGLKWGSAEIHADVDMIEVPTWQVQTLLVDENTSLDYPEATFTLTEKYCL
jgi:hypothetical protein